MITRGCLTETASFFFGGGSCRKRTKRLLLFDAVYGILKKVLYFAPKKSGFSSIFYLLYGKHFLHSAAE